MPVRAVLLVVAACALAAAGLDAQPLPVPRRYVLGQDRRAEASAPRQSDTRGDIRREQEAAQKRLDAIEASPDTMLGAPPDTPRREIAERLGLARSLTGIYQQQLDVLDRADAARHERAVAERALADWQGFPTPPPYSVRTVDALRDDVDTADVRIANAAIASDAVRAIQQRSRGAVEGKPGRGAARRGSGRKRRRDADGGSIRVAARPWRDASARRRRDARAHRHRFAQCARGGRGRRSVTRSRRAQARRRGQRRHAVPRRARGHPRRHRGAPGRARQSDRAVRTASRQRRSSCARRPSRGLRRR